MADEGEEQNAAEPVESQRPGDEAAGKRPRTSELAIGCLVCGIAAPVMFIIAGLTRPGVVGLTVCIVLFVLAVLALARIGLLSLGDIVKGGIALACVLFVVVTLTWVPDVSHGGTPRQRCTQNLHHIGIGLMIYQNEHNGAWPKQLSELYPGYADSEDVFVCPLDENPMTIGQSLKCSYHYVGPLSSKTEREAIIVYEKRGNHEDRRNVLFLDASVEWLDEEDFRARLRKSLKLVRKNWNDYLPQRQAEIEAFYEYRALP